MRTLGENASFWRIGLKTLELSGDDSTLGTIWNYLAGPFLRVVQILEAGLFYIVFVKTVTVVTVL